MRAWFVVNITITSISIVTLATMAIDPGGGSCPACGAGEGGCELVAAVRDECFYRAGGRRVTLGAAGPYYRLHCAGLPLGAPPLLPALGALRGAPRTVLERCAPPARPYSAALRALNVTVLDQLVLSLPRSSPLHPSLLRGLPALRRLTLSAAAPTPAPPDLFSPLVSLTELQLTAISLSPEALLSLPPLLESLLLTRCSLPSLPPAALARLSHLRWLLIDDPLLLSPPDLSLSPSLTTVIISAPLPTPPPLHTLINATLSGVKELRLKSGCGSLQRLFVMGAPLEALEGGWLGGPCGLQELWLTRLPSLSHVHERALEGASELRALSLSGCPLLSSLPPALFLGARSLQRLDLSRDGLTSLPGELVSPLTSLQWLDLSHNFLGPSVADSLGALQGLRTLRLDGNPLGDLCPDHKHQNMNFVTSPLSPLSPLTTLSSLSLSRTGALRICADWRRLMGSLTSLRLAGNNITALGGHDLRWDWREGGEVDLRGNPLREIVLSKSQYQELRPTRGDRVRLLVDRSVRCDCRHYWLARAMRSQSEPQPQPPVLPVRLEGVRCQQKAGDVLLEQADLALMVCEDSEHCAVNCSCRWRPHDDTLLAECADVSSLPAFPNVSVSAARLQLTVCCGVSDPSAESVVALAGLPTTLNLAGNDLRSAASLLTAVNVNLTLQLRDNSLRCDCTELTALHQYRNKIQDFENVTCSTGELVSGLHPEKLCRSSGGAVGLALGVVVLAVLGAVVVSPRLRRKAKRLLLYRHRKLAPEKNYIYDGFLAFSRHDWELAQLVLEQVEGRGLRLCVHWRDWAAGEWVPAAVQRSVACSRRTVALASPSFQRAVWARAELRQALAQHSRGSGHRPVLLVPEQGVPAALRAQAARCHVLRLGERAAWQRLHRLLAPPRSAAPAGPTSPHQPVPIQTVSGRASPQLLKESPAPVPANTAPCA